MSEHGVTKIRSLTIGQAIRKDFAEVFDKLGGIEGMYIWAKDSDANKKIFYSMFSKMVTKEVVTEDKNRTHDQFVKWIQEVEEQDAKQVGQPMKLVK
jgi:hypothetical protein